MNCSRRYYAYAIPLALFLMATIAFVAQVPEGIPSVSLVTPGSGPIAGGTPVTINGINFVSPASATFGGSAATDVVVVNGNTLTATTPAHAAGPVDVVVTVPAGTSAPLVGGFVYAEGPLVTSVYPTSGPEAGGSQVTLTGGGFSADATVDFGSAAATNVFVISDTAITCTSPAGTGTVHVTVTTSQGTSPTGTADQFTYTGATSPPTVTGVNPNSATTSGEIVVTITGTNFQDPATVKFATSEANAVIVMSTTSITCKAPAHEAGQVHVTVTTPAGTSAETTADLFTYTGGTPAPSVTGLNPTSGSMMGGTLVEITGQYFTGATGVKFGDTASTSVNVMSDTSIKAAAPPHGPGQVHVTVTTPYGTSATTSADLFTYGDATLPTVTAVSPNYGPTMGYTQVTISGTNFTGATAVTFGDTLAASFTVGSATSISATSPAHAAGTVHVTVTTPNGTSTTSTNDQFTFSDSPPPGIASVTPNSGPTSGGTPVTIAGLNFTGATAVAFGDTPATAFSVVSSGQISATSPPHGAGAVHVRVTTPNGTSQVTDYDLFTYTGGGSCTLTCTATVPATGTANIATSFSATATATGCSGTPTYSWTFGDGETSAQQNPSHTYTKAGTFSWSMTAIVGETLCQKYGTIQIVAPPTISTVSKMSSPFRLKVVGGNFHQNCTIKVNGTAVPSTAWKSSSKVIAMKGKALKNMCPNGQTVQITVANNDDGGVSAPYPFTP